MEKQKEDAFLDDNDTLSPPSSSGVFALSPPFSTSNSDNDDDVCYPPPPPSATNSDNDDDVLSPPSATNSDNDVLSPSISDQNFLYPSSDNDLSAPMALTRSRSSGSLGAPKSPGSGRGKHLVRRVSSTQCISTGKAGEVTDMEVEVLVDSTREPMDHNKRRKKELKSKFLAGKGLFKAAAETVMADNAVNKSFNDQGDDETKKAGKHQQADMFRNVANSVAARRRFLNLRGNTREEEEPTFFHGRLQVQTTLHAGDPLADISSSECSSHSSWSTDGEQYNERTQRMQLKMKRRQEAQQPHYRLALNKGPKGGVIVQTLRAFGISAGSDGIYDSAGGTSGCLCCGVRPNNVVNGYLHWAFRASFTTYFLSAALSFYVLTGLFALFIWGIGTRHPQCIHVNGVVFGTETKWGDFLDAYALSWTTFSTVGYGLVFPSTSAVVSNHRDCIGIQTLTTLESFIGILFSSFTGAIVFSKITRVRSQAQVAFSDPIVVKYGSGVLGDDDDMSSTNKSGSHGSSGNRLRNGYSPFPVLEFRVVNRLHSSLKGEIMDCMMQVVASIDARHADPSIQRAAQHLRRRKGKKRGMRRPPISSTGTSMLRQKSTSLPQPTIAESKPWTSWGYRRSESTESIGTSPLETTTVKKRKHTAFDEEIGGKLVPRRIFSKLEIDGGPDHPFFKRVWIARHTLDHHSPLLTPEARNSIRRNGNRWPDAMNNFEAVRDAVSFDQLLVSFSGTSNVDANSVYAQKVYEYGDMNVGYAFVTMLYRDMNDGSLGCDLTLLNDVTEQLGGGGEPLLGMGVKDFDDKISQVLVL